jgi:hypothetical protein
LERATDAAEPDWQAVAVTRRESECLTDISCTRCNSRRCHCWVEIRLGDDPVGSNHLLRFGNTIAFQTRSQRLAWEAHSASDNFLPLAISAASLALFGGPEASVLRIDRTAGSSGG